MPSAVDVPDVVAQRAETLATMAELIRQRADELEDTAVGILPFPRQVIRADIELAASRLADFTTMVDRLTHRDPVGTVALALPGNAVVSNPLATIGAAYLAGNHIVARLPAQRKRWSAVLGDLLRETLLGSVELTRLAGRDFIGKAMRSRGRRGDGVRRRPVGGGV